MFFCSTCGIMVRGTGEACPKCSRSLSPAYVSGPMPSISTASQTMYSERIYSQRMDRASRPVGVTILAGHYFFVAALLVLGGIGMLIGRDYVISVIGQSQSSDNGGPNILGMAFVILEAIVFAFAAFEGLVGWGLWKLKNWARIVTIILTVLSIIDSVPGFMNRPAASVGQLAISGLICWYLLKENVKTAFQ